MGVDGVGRRALILLAGIALAGCSQSGGPTATPEPSTSFTTPPAEALRLEPFLDGFSQPILLTHDGTPGVVYVAEQGGRVWRVANGTRALWLDITNDTEARGEQGLLGLAFEKGTGRAYVSYTDNAGDSILERRHADGERERLLFVDQPYANHNGGHVAFGPDGMLYFGLGDGGSAGDPQGNGQNTDALLGSLLRLNVSGARNYTLPPDNPWGLVWAKGLRNPWRFSFDRATGDLYIADVGQNQIEEIDFLPTGSPGGANFGWNAFEGTRRHNVLTRPFSEPIGPVAEYSHDDGCSVTGGHVYRGAREPGLVGVYFLADYCSGKVWGLRNAGGTWRLVELLDTELNIPSFGEDAAGELYLVSHAGAIFRLAGSVPVALRAP